MHVAVGEALAAAEDGVALEHAVDALGLVGGGLVGCGQEEGLAVDGGDAELEGGAWGGSGGDTKESINACCLFDARLVILPERDSDKERAALVRSMMRGPGKRSETMKYKQYYWKPLAKISRWDREDDL